LKLPTATENGAFPAPKLSAGVTNNSVSIGHFN